MLIAALFKTAKTWKQPNVHQQMNEENVVCIYNGILLSHKEEQNNAICSNRMELKIIILRVIKARKRNINTI